jgi:hypothetical protein
LTIRNIPLFSFSFCYCDTETGKWQASEKNNKSPFKQLNSRNPVKKFIDHDTGNQLARLELLFLIKTKNMQEQTNNASIFTKSPPKKTNYNAITWSNSTKSIKLAFPHSIIRYIHKFGKWQLSVESVEVEWGYSRFPEVLCLNEYIRT